MYRVPINFSCFLGWRSINDDMHRFHLMGEGQHFGFRQVITLTMTTSEVPTPEMVREYGQVLQTEWNKAEGTFDIVTIDFESFGSIIRAEENENDK